MSEDQVKNFMANYLRDKGYHSVEVRLGTRQGYDVEGVCPVSGRRLVIECKGEAQTGSQHARSWGNVASAVPARVKVVVASFMQPEAVYPQLAS